jgi:AraC-like DNA-binding protein
VSYTREPNKGEVAATRRVAARDTALPLNEPVPRKRDTYRAMPNRSAQQSDTHEASMSIRIACGLIEAVEQMGIARGELLRAAQIDCEQLLREDACVPSSVVYRICELALDLTGDPALGLHWAERLSAPALNPVSNLVAHSGSLREGLESLSKFHRLFSDQPSFKISERGDKVMVQGFNLAGATPRMQRFASEMLIVGVTRLIRSFSPQAKVDAVSFAYPMPEYGSEYTRVLDIAPSFDQPTTGFVFDRALMNVVSLHRDEDVHEALRAVAERRIRRLTQDAPFTSRVRDLLVEQGRTQQPDMNGVARTLGLSKRSLRRRLVSEGSSYKAVVKEALAIVAKQYLRDRRLTIQETAYEMGFADTSTFHRAFKRWTGRTPSVYRAPDYEQSA